MILHALEQGSGPPVCLLHGLFGRAQNLAPLARLLSADHRVLSLDLRNHGGSPHAYGSDYDTQARDVLETLAAHDALPASLLGHSMGGKVAMRIALSAPERCERLVIADIAPVAYAHHNAGIAAALSNLPLLPGKTRRDIDATLATTVGDPLIRAFLLQNLVFGAQPTWRIGLAEITGGIADIEDWPPSPEAAHYDGPTLFLAGARSDYLQPPSEPVIARLFPCARVEWVADAGHWLHADQPLAFGHAVATFLSARREKS